MIESKTTEFKREYTDDIKYAVVAFANTEGGKVYIGINDGGSARGMTDPDAAMLCVANMIRPDVTMFTQYTVEMIGDKAVVVLTV